VVVGRKKEERKLRELGGRGREESCAGTEVQN